MCEMAQGISDKYCGDIIKQSKCYIYIVLCYLCDIYYLFLLSEQSVQNFF